MNPWSLRRVLLVASLLLLTAAAVCTSALAPCRRAMVGVLAPFTQGAQWVRQAVTTGTHTLVPLRVSERARMEDLQERLNEAENRLRMAPALERENRELRALLDLPEPAGWFRVAAPVIAREPASWNRRFRLGKGASDAVEVGNVVLVETEVIGRVVEVTPHTALVMTVADPGCRLSVALGDGEAVGVLIGWLGPARREVPVCTVDYLPRDRHYTPGEAVVTSGLSTVTPGGLRVGLMVPFDTGEPARTVDSAYARVLLRPTARFESFRFAAIMCRVGGAAGPEPE